MEFRILGATEVEAQQRVTENIVEALGPERAVELRAEGATLSLGEVLDDVASRA